MNDFLQEMSGETGPSDLDMKPAREWSHIGRRLRLDMVAMIRVMNDWIQSLVVRPGVKGGAGVMLANIEFIRRRRSRLHWKPLHRAVQV